MLEIAESFLEDQDKPIRGSDELQKRSNHTDIPELLKCCT
jgi:hypothetical protein